MVIEKNKQHTEPHPCPQNSWLFQKVTVNFHIKSNNDKGMDRINK